MTYFEVFGLPKALSIDLAALEKSFHELSRKSHPDYFTTGTAEEKSLALRMTSLLNDAYRTLRHPIRRVEYLVQIEGFKPDGSKVPQSFLMSVFEINEQIEEVKKGLVSPEGIEAIRLAIREKSERFDLELKEAVEKWDQLLADGATETDKKKQLLKLTEILSESSYIRNLEEELGETA